MRIADMDWRMVEDYVRHDDRVVLPLGSVEQHATLSLATDATLSERVAVEAAAPLGVPVYPAMPFGLAPYVSAFPGTVTLRLETFSALLRDLLDSVKRSGFRRVLLVACRASGHPASSVAGEWMLDNPDCRVRVHEWWRAPRTWDAIVAGSGDGRADAHHAGWIEAFSWTALDGRPAPADEDAGQAPAGAKPPVDLDHLHTLPPFEARNLLGDGTYGGAEARSGAEMAAIWAVAVEETRALLDHW